MPGTKIGNIDFAADFSRVFLWQYDNAEKLNGILSKEADFVESEVSGFWRNYLDKIFNIDTADDSGLFVWGVLLGVPWGTYVNEDEETVQISTEMYRRMLKARFFCFGSNGSIPDINTYLRIVFDGSPVFCRDNYDMTVTFITYRRLTAEETAVLLSPEFLPIPAGVKINVVTASTEDIFGFENSELQTFDNGVFVSFNQ